MTELTRGIIVAKGENIDEAIRRFRQHVNRNGIMTQYMRKQVFIRKKDIVKIKLELRRKHNNMG